MNTIMKAALTAASIIIIRAASFFEFRNVTVVVSYFDPLSEEGHATNKLRSRIRVRGEHVFGRMTQMAMDPLRTIGLVRAHRHNALSHFVYNMDRTALLRRWISK